MLKSGDLISITSTLHQSHENFPLFMKNNLNMSNQIYVVLKDVIPDTPIIDGAERLFWGEIVSSNVLNDIQDSVKRYYESVYNRKYNQNQNWISLKDRDLSSKNYFHVQIMLNELPHWVWLKLGDFKLVTEES